MRMLLFTIALIGYATPTLAGVIEQRAQARADCRQQARAMNYVPNTQKWKNSIRACMIDRGFNGR